MLAAGGAERSTVTPDVPSLADVGVQDIDIDIWYAMLAPAGLPKDQVALLNAEMNAILADPDVRETLLKQGLIPTPGRPEDLARLIETDLDRWTKIVRTARIKAD